MSEILGEYLDRLITTSITTRSYSTRAAHLALYELARKKQGVPLTYLSARKLVDKVKKGDFVFLITGAGLKPYLWAGETDGPLGVGALGRMFDRAFGAKPVIITDQEKMGALIATCNAAELAVQPEGWVREREYGAAVAESFPVNDDEAEDAAERLIEKYSPVAMIAIEMTGINAQGVMHSMSGVNITPYVAKAHHLINAARQKGILTIGIGDGGNEIGFGKIYDELRALGGRYSNCSPCPCGDGVVTVVATDVLVPAAVSNWGAYGIEGCVSALVENSDVMHNEVIERRMLEAGVNNGLGSGFGRQMLDVDGTTLEANQALITVIREMIKNFLKKRETRAF
jgi:hypothetical protein